MDDSQRQRLMRRVAWRKQMSVVCNVLVWCVLVWAAGGVLWLIGSRVLGLWPEQMFYHQGLMMVPLATFILAATAAWNRRLPTSTVAQLIDRQTNSRDLFLTAATIDQNQGDYRTLVLERADQKAADVKAAKVVVFRWLSGLWRIAGALVILGLSVLYLPRLDPFGKTHQRQQAFQRQTQLETSRTATVTRIAVLQKQTGEEARVEQAVADLEKMLQQAKPDQKDANLQKLVEHQKELGQLWRQVNDAELKKALEPARVEQSFGQADPQQAERLRESLRKGEVSELKKELEQLKAKMDRVAAMPDSVQKQQAREQVQRQLGALADAAAKGLQTPGLNTALSRAMDQLNQGRTAGLSTDALKSAGESLDLSAKELESLARSMREMRSLEDALKSTQLAKQLNDKGALDGQDGAECKGIGDYASLYARKLNQGLKGVSKGMGPNPGLGIGGHAQENGAAKTAYQPEKSPTSLSQGKLLMQWKTDEISEPGQARQDYLASLQQVKQGVSEAILQEQAPPGYRDAIQKYFDTLAAPPVADHPASK